MMMKMLAVIAVSAALAATAGCNKPPQPKTAANGDSSGASASGASTSFSSSESRTVTEEKSSASDAALTAKVKTALANDAGLRTLKLDVDANSGVVSLKGRVDNDETKRRIQEITQSVPGVTWVQNQVSVAPNAS
jgi:osmotically-inducible protein OsmY